MVKEEKYQTTGEAIPIYQQLKEGIWDILVQTIKSRNQYRNTRNPLDLQDVARGTLQLYDLIRTEVQSDRKLKKNYAEKLQPLDKYGIVLPDARTLNPYEWNTYFQLIQDVLYSMNVTRITMDKDTDDDFAGVPGMDEVYQQMIKQFEGFKDDDDEKTESDSEPEGSD